MTNRIGGGPTQAAINIDIATNTVSIDIRDNNTYYWILPRPFLGNQLNSYGGYLLFTVRNDADGEYKHDQDVILSGSGITLFWNRKEINEPVRIRNMSACVRLIN